MADAHQRVGLEGGTIVDGRYRVEREMGRGGFARVYEATHTDLGRKAALKVIELPGHPGAVDAFIQRFLREARIAANLQHPNVVTVYDYGVVRQTGQPYLAMQYLDGRDLEMYLAHDGAIEPRRAVGLMLNVLDALDMAQSQGIVHKDLKPSNLFLVDAHTPRERLVLIDFGIARLYDDENSRLTQTGGFVGTPAYFAPEYVQHQIVTPAIDVYQSALILVEMMTALPVVIADNSMQYLLKHCSGQLQVPEALLHSGLGPVLQKALATDHTKRYPNCGEFRRDLAAVDLSSVPMPRRHENQVRTAVRSATLESSPNTDQFQRELASSDTLDVSMLPNTGPQQAGPAGPVRPVTTTRPAAPARKKSAGSGLIIALVVICGALFVGAIAIAFLVLAAIGANAAPDVENLPDPTPYPMVEEPTWVEPVPEDQLREVEALEEDLRALEEAMQEQRALESQLNQQPQLVAPPRQKERKTNAPRTRRQRSEPADPEPPSAVPSVLY